MVATWAPGASLTAASADAPAEAPGSTMTTSEGTSPEEDARVAVDEGARSGDGVRSSTAVVLSGGALLAGIAIGAVWMRRLVLARPRTANDVAGAVGVEPFARQQGTARPGPGASAERAALVGALVELHEMVSSDALRAQVTEQLAAVGVLPVQVDPGTRFDPDRHRGVQAVPATDPAWDGTVASCDRPGWADRGTTLRPPEVIVRRWEPT